MAVYCVFCKSNFEMKVARNINNLYGPSGVRAVAPVRILKERFRGRVREVNKPLMEGYVFVYSEIAIRPSMMNPIQNALRLLRYGNGECELTGDDLAYARFIDENRGVIGISDVFCEGGKVKVLSGPLESYKATIVKLDKRKQRVLIRVNLDGMERDVSLSVNILSALQA